MNVENTYRPIPSPAGFPTEGMSAGDVADGVSASRPAGSPLTVRDAPRDPAAASTRRAEAAHDEDALAADSIDMLVKSVLDFAPPPMPDFAAVAEASGL